MAYVFRFLQWFCPDHLYEEIEGDLIQKFNRDVKAFGEKKAKRRLIWNAVRFFRPGIVLRNNFYPKFNDAIMLRKNLILAFRQIRKNWSFSAINIFGLSIGMAACLLIFKYAFFEMNYDKQFQKNIYRVGTISYENGLEQYRTTITPAPTAPTIKEKFPEVLEATRLISTSSWFNCTLAYEEGETITIFNENKGFYFVDPSFISMFDISLLEGNKESLQKPYSIVLSASAKEKYFGGKDAIGKTLRLRGSFQTHDYTVTGIMQDFLLNSHLDVNIIASISSLATDPFDTNTYVQLLSGTNAETLTQKINELAARMIPIVNKTETKFLLEPIADIHLHSDLQDQPKPSGSAMSVYFLMLVAGIVLIIAWFNYVNLTSSRSLTRAREVGIRKVSGATRGQIIFQFLTETFVLNTISVILAILLVYFLSNNFYEWIGVPGVYHSLFALNLNDETIILLLLFFGGVVLSGLFPAQFISVFAPIKVLKGKWRMNTSGFSFRKTAVVFQFSCAIALAITVFVFQQQFQFMKEQFLGIDIKKSIVLKAPSNVDSTYLMKLAGFKNQLQSLAIIHSITTSTDVPGNMMGTGWKGSINRTMDGPSLEFGINVIDPDFIQSYQIKLLAGRNFHEKDFPIGSFGDKTEPVIINRRASELLTYAKPDDAIGGTVYWGESKCLIVGVLEEFHQESLKKAIQPMLYTANMGPSMTLKLTAGADEKISVTINQIQQSWDTYFPDNAFDYFFLEDNFNKQYEADERLTRLFNLFCLLALTISCLGIFALSLFSIHQRTKEISIRKVLGASSIHLIRILTNEYILLILIASVVALPLSYWGINQWLKEFAFHIEVSVWFFILPVILILIIALLTVGTQTLKVVIKNPTDSLKHE